MNATVATQAVFRAVDVAKVYQMGEVKVYALRGISLELYDDEFVVLLGASGSGKSTLLNILGGLDVPTSGTVHYLDKELTASDDAELTQYRRKYVGFVFQFYNLIPSLTARVQAAEATLQRSESNSEQATIKHDLNSSKYERAKDLQSKRVMSDDDFDTAKADYLASAQAIKTAKFDTEIARFELEMARAAVSQFADEKGASAVKPFEIHAPIAGKILRVFQESSTVVTVGTPLLELGDPQKLEVEIDVLSTDAVRIKPGAELTIDHWGGESPLRGNVRVIEPAAFTKVSSLGVEEQRVNIIADFSESADRNSTLGDGYRVEARITIDELPNALLIPNSSLFRHQREWHVLKIVAGKAAMQRVSIGLQNESHSQVTKGLSQGDQVIVYPSDDLSPGTQVRLVSGSASSTPNSNR